MLEIQRRWGYIYHHSVTGADTKKIKAIKPKIEHLLAGFWVFLFFFEGTKFSTRICLDRIKYIFRLGFLMGYICLM